MVMATLPTVICASPSLMYLRAQGHTCCMRQTTCFVCARHHLRPMLRPHQLAGMRMHVGFTYHHALSAACVWEHVPVLPSAARDATLVPWVLICVAVSFGNESEPAI